MYEKGERRGDRWQGSVKQARSGALLCHNVSTTRSAPQPVPFWGPRCRVALDHWLSQKPLGREAVLTLREIVMEGQLALAPPLSCWCLSFPLKHSLQKCLGQLTRQPPGRTTPCPPEQEAPYPLLSPPYWVKMPQLSLFQDNYEESKTWRMLVDNCHRVSSPKLGRHF